MGNLLQEPIDAIWNAPVAIEIRKTILNGSHHRCNASRCPFLAGGRPFPPAGDAEVEAALRQGLSSLPYGPKTLNLCFDGGCNLACRSCRDSSGQHVATERRRAEAIAEKVAADLASSTVEMRLSGYGDPFASPVYSDLLRTVGPETFPALRRLHLHTNGLLWSPGRWQQLDNLHPYLKSAEISVDAADGETFAENRGGASFDRLLDNLEHIAALPIRRTLSFVVQANNFRQMPAFVDLAGRFDAVAYFSQLVNWGTFSAAEFRKRAVHRPEHPRHAEFRRILLQVAGQPAVEAGNLLAGVCLR
ncbi:MAG: radical SAM protein [Desulfuromonadales bacterium]|nr:radical SAM protein [Desulfuromonadales bacterium]NIS42762.1 radical SAM protein [Desulfuromonadales bacterium]